MNILASRCFANIAKLKRESGENPERSGHCKRGTVFLISHCHMVGRRKIGDDPKSGDLPRRKTSLPEKGKCFI